MQKFLWQQGRHELLSLVETLSLEEFEKRSKHFYFTIIQIEQ